MAGLQELLDGVQHSFLNNYNNVKEFYINTKENIELNFLNYSTIVIVTFNNWYNIIYKTKYGKKTIDHTSYFFKYIYSSIINKKIEPLSTNWIASYVLSKSLESCILSKNAENTNYFDNNKHFDNEYSLLESYEFFENPYREQNDKLICETNYSEICYAVQHFVNIRKIYCEGLVKMKLDDDYVFRVLKNKKEFTEFKLPIIPSKARFLSIEYTHPIMKKEIVINLDKNIYFKGNEILSISFVKLYLEFQCELYHFDEDYILKIMDNNLNNFELGFDKYIVLTEDGYFIR
uniref:Uncharacterized protein n=1 Tax=viral metagenome TaxID=1070528 RepID=A0A6C0JRE9_9ZZZZ